jgi:hypothetical protein
MRFRPCLLTSSSDMDKSLRYKGEIHEDHTEGLRVWGNSASSKTFALHLEAQMNFYPYFGQVGDRGSTVVKVMRYKS